MAKPRRRPQLRAPAGAGTGAGSARVPIGRPLRAAFDSCDDGPVPPRFRTL